MYVQAAEKRRRRVQGSWRQPRHASRCGNGSCVSPALPGRSAEQLSSEVLHERETGEEALVNDAAPQRDESEDDERCSGHAYAQVQCPRR